MDDSDKIVKELKLANKFFAVIFIGMWFLAGLIVVDWWELRHFRQLYELHVEPYIRRESVDVHIEQGKGIVPNELPKEPGLAPKATPKHIGSSRETE